MPNFGTGHGLPSRFSCPACGMSMSTRPDVAAQWCPDCRAPMTRVTPPAPEEG